MSYYETTRYQSRVSDILGRLGIPTTYGSDRGLELQLEADPKQLVYVQESVFAHRQPQYLEHKTAATWREMQEEAARDGIGLVLLSGFRSLERHEELIQYRLRRGKPLEEILKWVSAPGYSEHHTGMAIDIGDADRAAHLEGSFEETPAFGWLSRNARRHGFNMSFPRENNHDIGYEPWHWRFDPYALVANNVEMERGSNRHKAHAAQL